MRLVNWWKRWKKGDPVCKVANAEALNRVYNVLEDLDVQGFDGIDAQIHKPTGAGGKGWTITIDGWRMKEYLDKLSKMPFQLVPDSDAASGWAVRAGSVRVNNQAAPYSATLSPAAPTYNAGTNAYQLPAAYLTAGEVWVEVVVEYDSLSQSYQYEWYFTYAAAHTASARYAIKLADISASGAAQHYHGDLYLEVARPQENALQYNDETFCIEPRNFQGSATVEVDETDDILLRSPPDTAGDLNRLEYLNLGTLKSMIAQMIADAIQDLIQDPSPLVPTLLATGYFQPVVSTDTTDDGDETGGYYGVAPATGAGGGTYYWTKTP